MEVIRCCSHKNCNHTECEYHRCHVSNFDEIDHIKDMFGCNECELFTERVFLKSSYDREYQY